MTSGLKMRWVNDPGATDSGHIRWRDRLPVSVGPSPCWWCHETIPMNQKYVYTKRTGGLDIRLCIPCGSEYESRVGPIPEEAI